MLASPHSKATDGPNTYCPAADGKKRSRSVTTLTGLLLKPEGNRTLFERASLQPGLQLIKGDRSVDAEQPADPCQCQTEAQLNRRELYRDQHHHRVAGGAAGQLADDQSDSADR